MVEALLFVGQTFSSLTSVKRIGSIVPAPELCSEMLVC